MINPFDTVSAKKTSLVLLEGAQELLGADLYRRFLPPSDCIESMPGLAARPVMVSFGLREMARFTRQLEAAYGVSGGRGLAQRIGRAAFKYSLQVLGDDAGLRSQEYRLLPPLRRLETGLQGLARVIAAETGDRITLTSEADHWQWRQASSETNGRVHAAGPACYLLVGFLQEFLCWAGGGRYYRVVESECRESTGPECVFRIDKKALD